jgi:hypothetical protein
MGPALFTATVLFYATAWAPLGLDTEDGGFILGLSWRILSGDVPYRDFFYVRPPLSLYLHALPLLLGDVGIYADRLLCLTQFAVIALCGTDLLIRATDLGHRSGFFWPTALAIFVFSVHHSLLFGWHTSDGVFFGTLAVQCASRSRYMIAGILAAAAMATKQNFAAVTVVLGVAALIWHPLGGLRYLIGVAAACALVALFFASADALHPMLRQISGSGRSHDVWRAGVYAYLIDLRSRPVLWGLGVASAVLVLVRLTKWRESALGLAYSTLILTLCLFFLDDVIEKSLRGQRYYYFMSNFPGLSATLVVAAGLAAMWALLHVTQAQLLERIPLLATLFSISWSSSISWNYLTPAWFAAPLIAPILLWSKPRHVTLQLTVLSATGIVVFGAALAHPYGEGTRVDQLVPMPQELNGTALLRTSPLTAAKWEELSRITSDNSDRAITVIPAFTPYDLVMRRRSPSPLDWEVDAEIPLPRPSGVSDILCAARALVLVEKDLAARVFDRKRGNPFYSTVLEDVTTKWILRKNGLHFAVYEPPPTC